MGENKWKREFGASVGGWTSGDNLSVVMTRTPPLTEHLMGPKHHAKRFPERNLNPHKQHLLQAGYD